MLQYPWVRLENWTEILVKTRKHLHSAAIYNWRAESITVFCWILPGGFVIIIIIFCSKLFKFFAWDLQFTQGTLPNWKFFPLICTSFGRRTRAMCDGCAPICCFLHAHSTWCKYIIRVCKLKESSRGIIPRHYFPSLRVQYILRSLKTRAAKQCSVSLRSITVWLSETQESGESDHEKKQREKKTGITRPPQKNFGSVLWVNWRPMQKLK